MDIDDPRYDPEDDQPDPPEFEVVGFTVFDLDTQGLTGFSREDLDAFLGLK